MIHFKVGIFLLWHRFCHNACVCTTCLPMLNLVKIYCFLYCGFLGNLSVCLSWHTEPSAYICSFSDHSELQQHWKKWTYDQSSKVQSQYPCNHVNTIWCRELWSCDCYMQPSLPVSTSKVKVLHVCECNNTCGNESLLFCLGLAYLNCRNHSHHNVVCMKSCRPLHFAPTGASRCSSKAAPCKAHFNSQEGK